MMRRWKTSALGLLAAVFLAGGAAGWLVSEALDEGRRRPGRRSVRDLVDRLSAELELSPAQKESVEAVLRRRHGETRAVWETMRPEVDRIRAATQAEIEAFLTSEQAARHRRMLEEEDRKRREREAEREKE